MKRIILGLFILFFTTSLLGLNVYSYTHSQNIIENVGNRIEKLINKKANNDKYKKLSYYLFINQKLNQWSNKHPKYKTLIKKIEEYLKNDYLKKLGIIPIKLNHVVDGDTIEFINQYNGKKYHLRMLGIDTPESTTLRYGHAECYGKEAKEHLKKLLSTGQSFRLFVETDKTQGFVDRYGRVLGYLLKATIKNKGLPKIENINGLQIKDGYAWEYTYDKYYPYIYQKLFKSYQRYAEKKGLGLWNKNTCNGKRISVEKIENKTKKELYDLLNTTNKGNNKLHCPVGHKVYCTQIKTCDEAMYYFKKCGAFYLDRNKDGIPCENLCK